MGLGRMPRTEESRKWRSTFTKTPSPQMGTNAAVGGCATQMSAHQLLKNPQNSEVCLFFFISQFCRFTLLLLDDISKKKTEKKQHPDRIKEQDTAKVFLKCFVLHWHAMHHLTRWLQDGKCITIPCITIECTVCILFDSFYSPLRMNDHSFALIVSHDNIIRRKA